VKVFVTGGTGFIGSELIHQLVARGHAVTALVHRRDAVAIGVRTVLGDVTDRSTLALSAYDGLIHAAASYKIGHVDRRAMFAVNVTGTCNVLDAAITAGVARIVHVSSTAALGDTCGREADEQHRHDGTFRSYYEQTKHIAHGIAQNRPGVMIAIPGGVFGAGDPSVLASTLRDVRRGKLPIQIATTSRFQLCHVARVCEGLIAILERGRAGESYVLAGTSVSMPELIARVTSKPPRAVPASRLRPIAAVCDRLGKLGIALPLSSEALRLMDGSTYVYRSDKARREFGWDPGDIDADVARYLEQL
jgi:dihydroflavonol-4-reductase